MNRLELNLLDDADIHRAMILDRVDNRMLNQFIGLVTATRELSSALLLLELLTHCEGARSVLEHLEEAGEHEGKRLLEMLRPTICDEWQYCALRGRSGFGDPRRHIHLLASVAQPVIDAEYSEKERKTRLATIGVLLTRSKLSELCHCNGH